MRAQIIKQFGKPEVFQLADLQKPEVKPGYALIKVHATSVNQIDCKIRSGAVPEIAPPFPAVLHGDVAGEIVAVGKNVKNFKEGDAVYGCAGGLKGTVGGALAEYMLVDARTIAHKPKNLSMLQAAALPLVGITAWQALFDHCKIKKGKMILIHGGVGGVGHIAVQLAHAFGAIVHTTVVKDEDVAIAKQYGADGAINILKTTAEQYCDALTKKKGYPIIFDTIGGGNLEKSFIAAAENGVITTTAARATVDLTRLHNKGLTLHGLFMLNPLLHNKKRGDYQKILTKLAEQADAGNLRPTVDPRVFNLTKVADAHSLLESGQAQGKIVIKISE